MIRNLKIYFILLYANLRVLVRFRADFILLILSGSLTQFLGVIFILTIFNRIPSIDGWNLQEILLIYSIVYVIEGLVSIFFDGLWSLTSVVNSGEFDRILLRPVSPMIQIATLGFGSQGIGNSLIGLVLLSYSMIHLDLLSALNILLVIVFIILGVIIRVSINYCVATISFWTKNGNPLMIANHSLSEFSKYPMSIYSLPLQALIVVVPYAFISYVPTVILLQKEGSLIFLSMYPLIIAYSVYCMLRFFGIAIQRYESSGH
ncbi:ABC-2 family transporter protein [Paenibacillus sp. FSL K6-4396]|uniref:ABC transporter permease n=1 Tax=unclassified Paenibacillus TaxID=185978 RepID=UPI0017801104|nr:ABC-2 family transporter protein [Paenibacillus sp. CFBP 13594]MBD8839083.1 ABC-2 family transporter protein [Paenibacillus sp. CFBP 13594]